MGLGSSKFSLLPSAKIKSKEDFKLKTDEMSAMADSLFLFMFQSSTGDHEAFDIAENPDKYVTALSELIDKQFSIIGYRTTRTVQGEIYFKSYKDLNPREYTGQLRENHKKNCKVIAFFFVRIYQILGSMLLVIKDNGFDNSTSIKGDPYSERDYIGPRLPIVHYRQQQGGAVAEDIFLGPLEFLRSNLIKPTDEDLKYIDAIGKRDTNDTSLYNISETDLFVSFKPYKKGITVEEINRSPPKFYILAKDPRNKAIMAFSYEIYIINMYEGILNDNKSLKNMMFRIKAKSNNQQEYTREKNEKRQIGIRRSDSSTSDRYKRYYIDTSSKSPDFVKAETSALQYYTFKFSEKSSVKFYLNFYFLNYAIEETRQPLIPKTDREQVKGDEEDHTTGDVSTTSSLLKKSKINNPVIKTIFNELQQGTAEYNKLLPGDKQSLPSGKHCIKRAIQLLNPEGIYTQAGSTEANYTRICKFSAPDSKERQVKFDHYVPTKSFAQLYGKISVNPEEFKKSQQILEAIISSSDHSSATEGTVSVQQLIDAEQGRPVKTETDDLKDALVRLKEAFKLLNEPADPSATSVPKGFNEIVMKTPKECDAIQAKANAVPEGEGVKDGGIVIQNDNVVRQLRDISQELLAYHVNSTIEITKFLQTVFNIDKDPSGRWTVKGIKESLLISGFPALDKITDIARDLLLKYYEGCETKYQKGVKLWLDENKTAAAAPAAGAVAAPEASAAAGAAAPAVASANAAAAADAAAAPAT